MFHVEHFSHTAFQFHITRGTADSLTRFLLDLVHPACYDPAMRIATYYTHSLLTACALLSRVIAAPVPQQEDTILQQNSPSSASETPTPSTVSPELIKRAQNGDTDAQVELGYYYSQPEHYNAQLMYTWFLQAARAGKLEAQATVGYLLLEGVGTPAHPPTALLWLEVAAEQQDTESQLMLASIYLNGSHGVPRDLTSAFRYFKQASEGGNSQAQLMLAICYENGLGCETDHQLAMSYAKKSAAQLNPQALCMMGDLTRKNVPHGTKIDRATAQPPVDPIATAYYLHAAFLGEMKSSYELAMAALAESGKKRMQDSDEKKKAVVELLEQAAMENYAPAMYELALCYSWGYGVERDAEYAATLMTDAASQGYEAARYMIAYMHALGDGTTYSLEEAFYWIHQ